jgi:Pentapeptide repeats (8 copies)
MRGFINRQLEKLRLWIEDPESDASHVVVVSIVVFILVAVALWIVWIVPQNEVMRSMDTKLLGDHAKQLELEDEFRKTLTQIVLSIFGLFILYFTWQRARAGDKTVQIMEQGHITDRYTKAIEQLGRLDGDQPNIEVRLGAIYALERIAHDSPRDHWTIMEVLAAYVRQNAPAGPLDEGSCKPLPERPRTEIQAILTVLGRRSVDSRHERPGLQLDLSSTNLQGAYLVGSNLQGAYLVKSDLRGAYLDESTLLDANLNGAYFSDPRLDQDFSASSRENAYYESAVREALKGPSKGPTGSGLKNPSSS